MGDQFVLEVPPEPITVRVRSRRGKTTRVHLTDDHERTLCGLTGELVLNPHNNVTCGKCLSAVDGKARARRISH